MYGLNDQKDEDIIERYIREVKPAGMDDGTHVTIEYFSGFELFNNRPYHNYETWSAGFRVKGLGVTIERENLVDAVRTWYLKVKKERERDGSM